MPVTQYKFIEYNTIMVSVKKICRPVGQFTTSTITYDLETLTLSLMEKTFIYQITGSYKE